jgi:hypothetical protein
VIALSSLGRFVAADRVSPTQPRCELCGGPLGDRHRHVVELGQHGAQCACAACGILFGRGDVGARFRTIPDRIRIDTSFGFSAEQWAALGIPVALSVCYRDSQRNAGIVCYPGPAGIVEAELDVDTWETICMATRLAELLEDDVEALLVRTQRGSHAVSCYLVPISTAYELVGRLRAVWNGFSGGERAEAELETFFAELERKGERA